MGLGLGLGSGLGLGFDDLLHARLELVRVLFVRVVDLDLRVVLGVREGLLVRVKVRVGRLLVSILISTILSAF